MTSAHDHRAASSDVTKRLIGWSLAQLWLVVFVAFYGLSTLPDDLRAAFREDRLSEFAVDITIVAVAALVLSLVLRRHLRKSAVTLPAA